MADTLLPYDDLPWAATFSVQAQLKRMADLLLAALLLRYRSVCPGGGTADLA